MGINLADLTVVDDTEVEKERERKQRERVADLIPVADKIKEANKRVQFKLDTEGANGELERLRTAARLQGFSLRIVKREPDEATKTTTVTVAAGKLIDRRTKEEIEAEEAEAAKAATAEVPVTTATVPAPAKSENAKPAKPAK